jgi:two-component system phosphate regulon sensor histidine kinase PhoR
VLTDREGLREMLDNLIDNAIKYTPEGGSVTVSWRSDASSIEHPTTRQPPALPGVPAPNIQHPASSIQHPVVISVTDTGIGIKPEDQKRVFERFYRVDKARSRELGGTGLGLSIVKHLAQSFGGNVGVESEPGKGSTFSITLPLA